MVDYQVWRDVMAKGKNMKNNTDRVDFFLITGWGVQRLMNYSRG